MSAPRTPSRRMLARVPSMGSSFASCFGASTPISPHRTGGRGLLGGQACVNYRRLAFDADSEDERTHMYEATAREEEEGDDRYEHVLQRREGPFLQNGKHFTARECGVHYASEGEEHHGRQRKTVMKLGKQLWTKREKAGMQVYHASETPKAEEPDTASEEEGDEQYVRERKGIRKLAKLWSMREKESIFHAAETPKKHYHATDEEEELEAGGYVGERKGVMKLVKLWTTREKARRGVYNASEKPKEEEHSALSEEIHEYGRERIGDMQHLSRRQKEGMCAGISPRRESLSRKVREACVQVLESARRSSPHLSELFVGNQLLMQVTSSSFCTNTARRATNVPRSSTGFVVAGDPAISIVSPPRSSASSSAF